MTATYLRNLLTQKEPLTSAEKRDLKEWLEALKSDVELYGETAEDASLIASIEKAIITTPTRS